MTVFNTRDQRLIREAGGLMLVGWEGVDVSSPLGLIEDFAPAGLIFFKRNYPPGGGAELAEQLKTLKARALEVSGRPLLVAIDNEGGLVKRLPPPHVQLPGAPEQASRGPDAINRHSFEAGCELKALGFNLNLAPVVDLAVPCAIMAERSYGPDPETVVSCALAFIKGFREAGVFCCAKHFPGLGAAAIDPHKALPTVDLTGLEMEPHLRPFAALAESGLEMVMTSHCLYPGLGLDGPATMSSNIVDILRNRFNFSGLLLSDDLEMGAVANNQGPVKAAMAAILAGHDLILVCRERRLVKETHQGLMEALSSRQLPAERTRGALDRLAKLLDHLGQP